MANDIERDTLDHFKRKYLEGDVYYGSKKSLLAATSSKRETIPIPHDELPSDNDYQRAARYVVWDIITLEEDKVPTTDSDVPSIRQYFSSDVSRRIPPEVVAHVDKYAYAGGLVSSVQSHLIENVIYRQSRLPGVLPSSTVHLASKIKLVSTPPDRHTYAKFDARDNPYMRFADDLTTSYLAAGEQFQQIAPHKAAWMKAVHDDLVERDPWSTIPKNKLTADKVLTGVEGPIEISSLIWFLREEIFPRTGSEVGDKGVDVHEAKAIELAGIADDVAVHANLTRTSYGINEFVHNRPIWMLPEFLKNDPSQPNYDPTRNKRFVIDPSRVTLRRTRYNNYYLSTDGQLNRFQPNDPPTIRPLLTCPADFQLSLTNFNHAGINSAYERGLFGEVRDGIAYPYNLNISADLYESF